MFGFGPNFAKRLAEPHHTRPCDSAATAVWRKLGQRRAAVGPVAPALGAEQPPDIAVELEDPAAAGALVQTVDVLRDQREAGLGDFKLSQGPMSGVGLGFRNETAAPVVPFPNQARIERE